MTLLESRLLRLDLGITKLEVEITRLNAKVFDLAVWCRLERLDQCPFVEVPPTGSEQRRAGGGLPGRPLEPGQVALYLPGGCEVGI